MTARVVVLGGGISGLAAAFEIRRLAAEAGRGVEVLVLEKAARAGGKIRTESSDGFLLEGGPNGYLSSRLAAVDLVDRLGLTGRTVQANEASARRFVRFGGRLQQIPSGPGALVRSGLLSPAGKLRLLAEPFVPGRRGPVGEGIPGVEAAVDETVAEFGRRRIGRQATARLLDPFLTGIYAGDIERTSMAAAFPRIVTMEREYGGLVRGMIGRRRAQRALTGRPALAAGTGIDSGGRAGPEGREGREGGEGRGGGPSGPGGTLTSFRGGMCELTERLVEVLGEGVVRTAVDVVAVKANDRQVAGHRLEVQLSDGERLDADAVVLAVPAHAAAGLLAGLGSGGAAGAEVGALEALGAIPYAPVAVVGLGYRLEDLRRPPDGFGYLTPRSEGGRVLGMLWSHCIFPGARAPGGHALLRCIVGGVRSPELVAMGDDELIEHVRGEVREIMGEVQGRGPQFRRVVRWARGIPQYERGHLGRVGAVDALCEAVPGLYVGGNGLRGVSLADCCSEGLRLAEQVLADLP